MQDLSDPGPSDIFADADMEFPQDQVSDGHPDGEHESVAEAASCSQPPEPKNSMGRRGHADNTVHLDGGSVAWHVTTNRFEARCNDPAHGDRCRLTRSSLASKRPNARAQGRPLGLLSAWLSQGLAAASRAAHTSNISYDEREFAKEDFKTVQGGLEMLARERKKRSDEESEPEDLP